MKPRSESELRNRYNKIGFPKNEKGGRCQYLYKNGKLQDGLNVYDKDSLSNLPRQLRDDHELSIRTMIEGRPRGVFTFSKNKAIKAESSHLGLSLYSKLQEQY